MVGELTSLLVKTGGEICPVAAVLGYIAFRGPQPGPFFVTRNKAAFTKPAFITHLRKTLSDLGFPDDQYAGHSFRIGAATSAALAGMQDSTIQLLGRWQSAAFLRYIRTSHGTLAALSQVLAKQGQSPAHPAQT